MRVAAHTLGCKNNQLETATILDEFAMNGWVVVEFSDYADVYIINTCTVTAKSDSHSRSYIRKAIKTNPEAKVIVTGCYAQMSAKEVQKINGVSMIVGNVDKNNIYNMVVSDIATLSSNIIVKDVLKHKEFDEKKVFSASGRTRINVKVQDGCNYRCSYCIVPLARGPSRSNKSENVINQINEVSKEYPEVVLTGIHLGQYGLDFNPKGSLSKLLKDLIKIDHLQRIRLSSIDPLEITDELIDIISSTDKICRYLHISLQSADDDILNAMKRRYSVDKYTQIIDNITKSIDGVAIGSDIIVGFPGETDKHFENTYNNLSKLPLSYFHVFSYSKRPGTIAASMPNQIDPETKKYRNKKLKVLSDVKNLKFRSYFKGKVLNIIPEQQRDKNNKLLKGISDNYITVHLNADDTYKAKIVPVEIIEVSKNRTTGKLIVT